MPHLAVDIVSVMPGPECGPACSQFVMHQYQVLMLEPLMEDR